MKKFIISSDHLSKAIKKLSLAVSSKSVIPVLGSMRCRVTKGKVEFTTTDLELTISQICDAETGDSEFDMLLPFEFFSRIVSKIHSAPVTVEHPSTRRARILGPDDIYEINSLDKVEDFPKVAAVPKDSSIAFDENLVELLTMAAKTTGDYDLKPAFSFVCMDVGQKEMHVVSTDSHVLYKHRVAVGSKSTDQLLISSKMVKALAGLQQLDLRWNEKHICFKTEAVTVISTRADVKFVNYKAVIPSHPANLSIDRASLIDALDKTTLNTTQPNTTRMYFKKVDGRVHFESDDTLMARKIQVDKSAEYSGETEVFQVNANKLLTIMSQIDVDKVSLHVADPKKAMLVSSDEDTDYLGLIMPIND